MAELKFRVVLVDLIENSKYKREKYGVIKIKRLGNDLFDKICSIENLVRAHENARKGKSHYTEVIMVDSNPLYYLNKIRNSLIENEYKVSKYNIKTIMDKSKEREIYILPYFPDRIIQWAIMLQIKDRIEKNLITTSYASIPNRGIHKALNKISYDIRKENPIYYLKVDIRKFYPSIDKEILKIKVAKIIKCKKTLSLIFQIIDSVESGIPIGNYLSQYLGNLYLSELDHYCKEKLKCKMYYRYMDDIVILHTDKKFLHKILTEIDEFLKFENLALKQNYRISNIEKEGIDFLGFRHFGNKIILRKSIKNKLKNMTNKNISSYYGWVIPTDCYNLKKKYFKEVVK